MIVVAENDDGTRTVLASALARSGYDVASVTDGQLVLSTLASGDVGLLILDLRMPGMNGWEVLRRLKDPADDGSPPTTRPPVIVISAQSDPETQRFATRLGAAAFLAKPIDLHDLSHTVRRVLRQAQP
jgi:CheY-like chemotaxis protein